MIKLRVPTRLPIFFFVAMTAHAAAASRCEVRQRVPVLSCPFAPNGPEDCFSGEKVGKSGDKQTVPATIHIMSSGHSYYCPSHEGCVELQDLSFNRCVLTYLPRSASDSKKYVGHFFVDDQPLKSR